MNTNEKHEAVARIARRSLVLVGLFVAARGEVARRRATGLARAARLGITAAAVLILAVPPLPAQSTESVLYSFTGAASSPRDGVAPAYNLLRDGTTGNLYGVTESGGASGFGTVFELVCSSSSGSSCGAYTEKVLYSFTGTNGDGVSPVGGVVRDALSGNLYGATTLGGAVNEGTVFELVYSSSTGTYTEKVLHSFDPQAYAPCAYVPAPTQCLDGELPYGGVVLDSSGNLYGTTELGGNSSDGIVFELVYSSSTGTYTEEVLHTFKPATASPPYDGGLPYAGVIIDSSGNLYGTASLGGAAPASTACPYGCGIVFELVNSSGSYTENVLYQFKGGTDGNGPNSDLVMDDLSGNLYGTTQFGGSTSGIGSGTAFELVCSSSSSPCSGSYTENVLHAFTGPPGDGETPSGGLILDSSGDGNLYGTTSVGGAFSEGTVFELVNSSGNYTETVLYSFNPSFSTTQIGDGAGPAGGLAMDSSGNLYGTTTGGGYTTPSGGGVPSPCSGGCGTVFEVVPHGGSPYASYTNSTSGSPTQVVFGNVAENVAATQTLTLANTGTGPLTIQGTAVAPGIVFSYTQVQCNSQSETLPLSFPFTVSPGVSCIFTMQFDPNALGPLGGSISFLDNAGAGESNLTTTAQGPYFTQAVPLSGTGVSTTATTTTITSTSSTYQGMSLPANLALVGNPVTVNFTVQPVTGSLVPSGTVIVEDGFQEFCNPVGTLVSQPNGGNGKGSCPLTINRLGAGSTPLSAQYTPDTASTTSGLLASATVQPLFVENIVQITACGSLPSAQTSAQGTTVTFTFSSCTAADVQAAPGAVVTGCPTNAQCTATVTSAGPGVYTVVVKIVLAGSGGTIPLPGSQPRGEPRPLTFFFLGVLLATLLALQLARQNRARPRPRFLYAAGFLGALLLGAMSGCHNSSLPKGQGGTPPQTYTINVTVSAAGFSTTVPLSLTVTK